MCASRLVSNTSGVELMQVGTVRMAQHRVALKDLCTRETMMTRHSYSLIVVMPIFAASELPVRSLLSMLRSVASRESRLLQGAVLCMYLRKVVV